MGWTATHVAHDELVGGAAADMPDNWVELYRAAGVDMDRWLVVALDLTGSYRTSRGALLAVPRPAQGLFVDWQSELSARDGVLQVRRFPVPVGREHEVQGGLGLLTQLKRWSVRLLLHPLGSAELDVLVDSEPDPA